MMSNRKKTSSRQTELGTNQLIKGSPNEYWNRCKIIKVIHYKSAYEDWLWVENEDRTFKFKLFASQCRKFYGNGHQKNHWKYPFNKKKYRVGKVIQIKIKGHIMAKWDSSHDPWNEGFMTLVNKSNHIRQLLLGKIIKVAPIGFEGDRGRLLKSRNLYIYFIDNSKKTRVDPTFRSF